MYRIFLLDLDDTLLDFVRAERKNLARTLRRVGVRPSEPLFLRYHAINDALWRALERGEISREALLIERFRRLFSELSLAADPVRASEEYFAGFPAVCYPFRGARAFLKTLKNSGRVYICTNGSAVIQHRHIARAHFGPFLDGVFISEEIGANKPSAAFSAHVAAHIPGFRPDEAVYLGDSLTSDKGCAEALGVRFLLFAPRAVPAGYLGEAARTYREALLLL